MKIKIFMIKMGCLLKKTKLGRFEFCKDNFNLERYSTRQIMECQRKHRVEHCIDCELYPDNVTNVSKVEKKIKKILKGG